MANQNPDPNSLNVVTARTPEARQAALEAWKLAEQALAKLEPYLAEEDAPRDTLYDILESFMRAAQRADIDLPPIENTSA